MPDVSTIIANVVRLADQLAREQPRSLDIAIARYQIHQLAKELAKPGASPEPSPSPPHRRRRRAPGYWAERKRIQRARNKSRISTEELR
jgi:hypothetical protein